MKKFFFCLTLIPSLVFASDFPRPQGPVNDFARVLDAKTQRGLTTILTQLEKQTGIAFVIAVFPSLEGADIETFAVNLYQQWGIGKKGADKGILMVAAIQDRTARIEVGYGLEALIPDALAGRILREILFPYFKKGQYGEGFLGASLFLIEHLSKQLGFEWQGVELSSSPHRRVPIPWPFQILFLLFFIYLFLRHPFLLLFVGPWSRVPGSLSRPFGGGFRGGGSGGGFGGFGGGLSGGGGASGRW